MMAYLISMSLILLLGVTVLTVGIFLLNKDGEHGFQKTLEDSLSWGSGFLVAFGAEFVVLANV